MFSASVLRVDLHLLCEVHLLGVDLKGSAYLIAVYTIMRHKGNLQ